MKFIMMTLSIALLLISFTGANASGIGSSCSDYHDCGSGLYCYDSWSGNVCTSCTDTLWPCNAYNSIDDKCCPGTVDGTYDSTLDFAYASSGNSCCNQLDCGVLEKCVSASAMGITACACDTDRGKVAGVAFGVIAGFILLICIPLCWCLKCCCFKKPPEVVIVQAPQATVAQA